jgi:ribose transport system permease protein
VVEQPEADTLPGRRPLLAQGLGRARAFGERWSLGVAFLVTVAVFGAAKPEAFLTWENFRSILTNSAPLVIVSCGITFVLALGEFDLSAGAAVGASSAAAVASMSHLGVPTVPAVLLGLGAGLGIGIVNGINVAILGISSFIGTLAVGSLATGMELAIAKTTIFEGISPEYVQIARYRLFGEVPLPILIAAGVGALLVFTLRATVFGRYATAIGDSAPAAGLAGVPLQRIRIAGFAVAGLMAAVAGILVSSQAASYYPSSGTGYLLPAYAAAFLGLSLGRGWRFNIVGTYLGVLFLNTVTTGLAILNQPAWVSSLVDGLVLIVAVLAFSRRRRSLIR